MEAVAGMMIFAALTDDQLALSGCAVALLVCGGAMWVSYFVGQYFRGSNLDSSRQTLSLPLHEAAVKARVAEQPEHRRAA